MARERGGAYPQVRDLRSVPVVERLVEFARVEKGGLRMGQASEGTHVSSMGRWRKIQGKFRKQALTREAVLPWMLDEVIVTSVLEPIM